MFMAQKLRMNTFLPEGYEIPESAGGYYLKFKPGTTQVRILRSPVVGFELWSDVVDEDGKKTRKSVRKKSTSEFTPQDGDKSKARHFWAMPVWNYKEGRVQIWTLTQKGIMKSIRDLCDDAEWGSPINYDLKVTRRGESKNDTEYQIMPSVPKPIDADVQKLIDETPVDMQRFMLGEDPFDAFSDDNLNPDDIDF